jgi:hypothetical protein
MVAAWVLVVLASLGSLGVALGAFRLARRPAAVRR